MGEGGKTPGGEGSGRRSRVPRETSAQFEAANYSLRRLVRPDMPDTYVRPPWRGDAVRVADEARMNGACARCFDPRDV